MRLLGWIVFWIGVLAIFTGSNFNFHLENSDGRELCVGVCRVR